ncbi:AbfB domain-containing protein [Streptomyces griseus]|uniref:AbfB domain-containing protein n=1 Tax=Streptomyces griseus TaxID=1911 RepID=UPI00056D826F|nr:AbfB domain-containing protein [Streptomyces griseus]
MPENKSRPPQEQPWENGWAPDTSRTPGTRRLWLAGGLAVATIAACAVAITATQRDGDGMSGKTSDAGTAPGLISFGTPSPAGTKTPKGKSAMPYAAAASPTPLKESPTPTPTPTPTKAPAEKPAKPAKTAPAEEPAPKPATNWRSVRSANYPDRYWYVSGSYVKLAAVSSGAARQDVTFALVKGLANGACYSFATTDGGYLRHRNFVLRAEHDDGSSLFEQDATFCPRVSPYSGATMLESVNYPGRFLRHKDFQIRLDPYQYYGPYAGDSAFRLVGGLA